jgi:hypothetical protein
MPMLDSANRFEFQVGLECHWKCCQIEHLHPLLCPRNTANKTTIPRCYYTSIET